MAITSMEINEGPEAQVAMFVEACWAVWAHAQWIVIYRMGKGKPVQIAKSGVLLVYDKEGKLENDVANTVSHFVRIVKADAERQGAGTDYKFELWGPRELSDKRRKIIAPPEELHGQRIRFGEGEPEAGGDAGMLREAGNLLKTNAAATHDLALSSGVAVSQLEKVLTIQTGIITAQANMISAQSDADYKHASIQVDLKKLEIGFEQWKAERQQQAVDDAANREHETRRMQAEHAYHMGMLREGKELASMFLGMWQISKGFSPAQPPPPPGVEPSNGTIAGDLRVLLTNITAEEKAQMKEILGHDLWSMILSASRASDDDGARAVLEGALRYIKQNPSLAGNLFAAGKVIAGPRFDAFVAILKRGGAVE